MATRSTCSDSAGPEQVISADGDGDPGGAPEKFPHLRLPDLFGQIGGGLSVDPEIDGGDLVTVNFLHRIVYPPHISLSRHVSGAPGEGIPQADEQLVSAFGISFFGGDDRGFRSGWGRVEKVDDSQCKTGCQQDEREESRCADCGPQGLS